MIYQLRTYTVNSGMMDAWVELFNDSLVPMQNQYGISIDGMWVNEDQNQFIWIRSFNDAEDVKAKEAAFYASPEWNGIMGHARTHLARIRVETMTSVMKVPAGA
jgi:hypothetical protein